MRCMAKDLPLLQTLNNFIMNTRFKYVVALVALLFTNLSLSKAQTTVEKAPKKIEVTGSAEEEVMPDKLYISITLKEYFKDKDNKARVDILTLEQQLQKAVADAGIAKENLTVGALNGSREWWGKKKPTNYLESKTYILLVSNLSKIDGIINRIDEKGVAGTNIDRLEYSKIETLRKDVKIKALKAAKEKAGYLLEGIGEQLGEALDIVEIDNGYSYPQPVYAATMMKSARMESADAAIPESTVEIQKVKVRYEIKAIFRIK